MSEQLIRPGLRLGSYPQKKEPQLEDLELAILRGIRSFRKLFSRHQFRQKFIVKQVAKHQDALLKFSDAELNEAVNKASAELYRHGLRQDLIILTFAIVREVAARTLGKRHFDEQLFGGWLMINGQLAEMQTGEGKTLTMTLPACTAALAGIPVHVITANDYLAARDCEIMQPLYDRLGLSSASVVDGMETAERQQNYACNIVHTTNKQIAFDYLRDRIEMGDDTGHLRQQYRQIQQQQRQDGSSALLLNGLCFALIDEADSVLIDEAKTPLIITKTIPSEENTATYTDALYLASTMVRDRDFHLDEKHRAIELSEIGKEKLEDATFNLPKVWHNYRKREMLVKQALSANFFYLKDRDYVVKENKVQIIDQSTGRVMADRSWEQGLHQMIEAKEGCKISDHREPQARISYQRFFSRYLKLGGTSGTISEIAGELKSVYGLSVTKVATHQPPKRKMLPERIYRTLDIKFDRLQQRLNELHQQQRPVLIGTGSVAESELVSVFLEEINLPHRLLNARQDEQEAEIIAQAGQLGAITISTNIAGRGTDIALGPGVEELGGLHVIALCRNESRRVDRQLYGRCARQGDPGSAQAILSLEDSALLDFYSSAMINFMSLLCPGKRAIPGWISRLILSIPQKSHEKKQRKVRKMLMKQDRLLRRILAISGKFE